MPTQAPSPKELARLFARHNCTKAGCETKQDRVIHHFPQGVRLETAPLTREWTQLEARTELGKRLRAAREEAGLENRVLAAEKAGIEYQMLAKIEAGRAAPGLGLLLRLARAFDVSMDELLDGINWPLRTRPAHAPPSKGSRRAGASR